MPLIRTLTCLAWAACSAAALADEGIATDRPDFVESSAVMDKGRVQLELGVNLERSHSAGQRGRAQFTPALLRVGLGHALEARIETDGMIRARVTDDSTGITTRNSGFSDVSLGLKWHSSDGDEKAGTPSTAWLFHLDMNSGSAAFRGDGVRPSLRFVAEWDLPGDTSIGVMPGLARDTDDNGRRFTAGILAVTVSTEIAPGWRAFIELAGLRLASGARGGNLASLDGGVTYLINPDMQVDASFQRGITRNTPFLGLGLGWSIRF